MFGYVKVTLFYVNSKNKYTWFLKDKFQHVAVGISTNFGDLFLDPLSNKTCLALHHPLPNLRNIPTGLLSQSFSAINETPWISIGRYGTCVQRVKKLLGIKNIFIQTPYQLYKYIEKNKDNVLFTLDS